MFKIRLDIRNILWAFIFFSIIGFLITISNKKNSLSSYFFAVTFCLLCMCIVLCIACLKCIRLMDPFWIGLLIIALATVNVIIGSHSANRTFDYYGKLLRFDATIMMIYVCTRYKIEASAVWIYNILNQILALSLAYHGIITGETYYRYETLTLGFPNPNQAGMWAALCFGGIMWGFMRTKSHVLKFIYLGEMCLILYLLERVGCRSGMLAVFGLIGMIILTVIRVKKHGIKRLKKGLYRCLVVIIYFFPFIFPMFYMGLYYSGIRVGKVGNQDFYSGREILWFNALAELKHHFMIGAYNEVSWGTGRSQLHNIYIDVLCSYGIGVFLLFLLFVFWVVVDQLKKIHRVDQYAAFFAFIMMFFISGTYEASYISGDVAINYGTCLFLLFSNTDKIRKKYLCGKERIKYLIQRGLYE